MRPGRAADHSPSSSAAIMEEYGYTSTHPLGHTGPVTGTLYLYMYIFAHVDPGEGAGILSSCLLWSPSFGLPD